MRRRQWFVAGVGLELAAVGLAVALFTTPLERHILSGGSWFILVTALQIASGAASIAAWKGHRDVIGLTALAVTILTGLLLTGLVFVFLLIEALSGLR